MGCSPGKRRSYPLHARRAAAARRAGGAHCWPRVFKLARNGDETAVCRRPKAVNACLLRPHPSSYTHGSIHRKQRLHIWPQCRAHSISWHVAIASLTLLEHFRLSLQVTNGALLCDAAPRGCGGPARPFPQLLVGKLRPWCAVHIPACARLSLSLSFSVDFRDMSRKCQESPASPAGLSSPPARSLQ